MQIAHTAYWRQRIYKVAEMSSWILQKRKAKKNMMGWLILIALLFWIFSPTWTPAPPNKKEGIAQLVMLPVNGTRLAVLIRGEHRDRPILLFVHGGPGSPEMPYVRKYMDLLEQDFVVVHYDQRGAGKSYHWGEDYSQLTGEQLVADLLALTDMLRERLDVHDVILAGHSYGSVIGIQAAARAPEKYCAYLGIGQIGDFWQSQREAYQYCLEQAQKQDLQKDIEDIAACHELIWEKKASLPRHFIRKYGGAARQINETADMIQGLLLAPEYNLYDGIRYVLGKINATKTLWRDLEQQDPSQQVQTLAVPCYFISGQYDYLTPRQTAMNYLQQLQAPVKEMVFFEHSAHYPQFEEKEAFYAWLKAEMANIL